jgi:predicted DNA-binding transcriptional regulator AlpA
MSIVAAALPYNSPVKAEGTARPMTTQKRKIKAKPLVNDLRLCLSDEEIMAKYGLNEAQFFKLLKRLEEAGLISEIEVYQRTTLSESTVMRAMAPVEIMPVESEEFAQEPPKEPDTETVIECTEVVNMTGSFRNLINSLREGAVKVANKEIF